MNSNGEIYRPSLPTLGDRGYRGQQVIFFCDDPKISWREHLLGPYSEEQPYEFTISRIIDNGYVILDELRNPIFIYFEIAEKYFYDKTLWETLQVNHPAK